ncbi:MAG: seg [Candidatus Adlerbacteria bacterium]|nr:seg [Candidatus Adlerbacteria bacterium]
MAQYQVPQFIEVEDKIFGPLTLRQFIYLAGGAGLSLIFFTLLPLILALPLVGLSVGIGTAFAFYKVNGRPLISAAEHAFSYALGHKLYLWKQRDSTSAPEATAVKAADPSTLIVPRLSQSRLKDLSWSLNIKDHNQAGDAAPRSGFQI